MNRLLTRRRAKDGGDILSKGKKGKKGAVAKQPEIDLDAVLPSTENFRTSLLLPNLSARFSMLREQDDPTSLLGKASDDSVLHPKRASRLPDFGYASGLSDIAEVSSFSSLVKPPFADQRVGSMTSTNGSATDDGSSGSVMNRSRNREGNNLFGGRQKTFKVSVSPSDEITARERKSYEDSPELSASYHSPEPKKNATKEEKNQVTEEKGISKENTLPEDAALALLKFDDDGSTDFSNSPSSEYQGKRATSSTSSLNSSGPSFTRASTAATSIASQGANSIPPSPAFGAVAAQAITSTSGIPEKPMARSRRLHEQSTDLHYHEQQNLALSRLNSLQKQRSMSAKALSNPGQPKLGGGERSASATALDRPSRTTALPPPPMGKLPELNTFDIGKDQNKKHHMLPVSSTQSAVSPMTSPISPFAEFHENRILTHSLEPGDRGKATALGAFNKPRPFDEQQYLERQKQMQQRIGPSSHVKKEQKETVSLVADDEPSEGSPHFSTISPQSAVIPLTSPTIPNFPMATYKTHSAHSDTSNTLTSDLKAKNDEKRDSAQPQTSVEPPTGEEPLENLTSTRSSTGKQLEAQAKAEANNISRSSLDPAIDKNSGNSRQATTPTREPEPSRVKDISPSPKSHLQRFEADQATDIQPVVDSPTLGPGLSGLVKQHLRNVSNVSSVYSVATVAGMAAVDSSYPMPALDGVKMDIPLHSTNDQSDTWNNDDHEVKVSRETDRSCLASTEEHVNAEGKSRPDAPNELNSDVKNPHLSTEIPQQPNGETKKKHNRDGSTETQHERKEFANELINRQRQIQENLRNRTQLPSEDNRKDRAPNRSESRLKSRVDSKVLEHNSTHSPALGMSAPFKAWSAIKSVGRDSASSLTKETSSSSKVIKGFGSGGSSPTMSSTSLASLDRQKENQQADSRKPSADGAIMKLPSLSEGRRPSDLQVADDGKARQPRSREHTMPYRPRGRLPRSNDTNGQQERNNQIRRGQSEGPQASRPRRPTITKAESDGRDRMLSESDSSGFPLRRKEESDLNDKPFNLDRPQKSALKTAPLPSKATFPFAKSLLPDGSNNEPMKGQSPASDANKVTGKPPRGTRTGVQPGLGSQRKNTKLVQPAKDGPSQDNTPFSGTSTTKSPIMSPNPSTAPSFPSVRTTGLSTGARAGVSPIAQVPNPGSKADDSSSSPMSPAVPATTTPLSMAMAIKSGNVTPASQSASASPSTSTLVPPDLPTVPIRLGSGGPPRKRLVNKIEISDPTFVSSTSTVETVTLEFAKQNQSDFPSSIPEINTGRRRTEPFVVAATSSAPQSPLNGQHSPGEHLKGSGRLASAPTKPMKRLRHVLSEGHGLYGKARQQQQRQQKQTVQSQQGDSMKSPSQPYKSEFQSAHVMNGAVANQRVMMPAAITVNENGMF